MSLRKKEAPPATRPFMQHKQKEITMVRNILPLLLVAVFALAGCGPYGQVEQGRAVAYDKTTYPATVWIIADSSSAGETVPVYDKLPVQAFKTPEDPAEMGAEPRVGLLLGMDTDKRIVTMYNPETKQLDRVPFTIEDKQENVSLRRQDPLVYDPKTGKTRVFPIVDAANKTVTIYQPASELYTVIKLSDEDFAKYGKEEDWATGDEVRIYYKDPGVSLRFMNVTTTDFSKK